MESETRAEAPFGEWLVRKLRERDMTLSDVARLAQCDYTYLWRLVNVGRARGRQYRRPSYGMAERVGRALGATHEALTAAGYLPAENLQNSRVVDVLDRVERQLARLREELSRGAAAGVPNVDSAAAVLAPAAGETDGRAPAGWRMLPLIESEVWPDDPGAVRERIELPEWLAADAVWAVRVGTTAATELRPGDLALIGQGPAPPGRLAAVVRAGKLVLTTDPEGGLLIGTVAALVRQFAL